MKIALTIALLACAAFAVACDDDDDDPQTANTVAPAASAVATAASTAPAASPTTGCPPQQTTNLGNLVVSSAAQGGQATLEEVTASTTACYDRIVFEFAEAELPGHEIRYVQSSTECGSGAPVTTQGPAQLEITMNPARAHDDNGNATLSAQNLTPGYPSVKEIELTCDFEAHVNWTIGTEMRFFAVTYGQSPTRIIVDVYH